MMSHDSWCPPAAVAAAVTASMMMTTATATAQDADRSQPEQIEWDLGEIYPSYEAWNTAKTQLGERVAALAAYRGRLGESAATLREAFDAITGTEKELARLYVFAFLKADEDRRVAEAQERRGLAAALLSEFNETVAFVSPELLRVGSETVQTYLAEEPGLATHAFNIRNTLRQEPHTLSDEAEQVIAATGPVVQGPERVYAMLTSSDMPFPTVTLSTGEEVRLDQAAYSLHRASRNRGPTASWCSIGSGARGRPMRPRWVRPSTPTSRRMCFRRRPDGMAARSTRRSRGRTSRLRCIRP